MVFSFLMAGLFLLHWRSLDHAKFRGHQLHTSSNVKRPAASLFSVLRLTWDGNAFTDIPTKYNMHLSAEHVIVASLKILGLNTTPSILFLRCFEQRLLAKTSCFYN